MRITNDARDLLKQVFKDNTKTSVRLFFAGYGWSEPQIGMALEEPAADDKQVVINEIKVAIDPNIEPFTDNLTLDHDKDGNGLVLFGSETNC